jgi:WD40 repeat protein
LSQRIKTLAATVLFASVLGSQPAAPPQILDISLSADGRWKASLFAESDKRTLELREQSTGITRWTASNAGCFTFGLRGEVFVWSGNEFQARDAATGQILTSRRLAADVGSVCAISADGRSLATSPIRNTHIVILETAGGTVVRTMERFSSRVFSLSFSPDGQWLASGEFNRVARLWEAATGIEQATFPGHLTWVSAVRFSRSARCLITSSYGGFKVWDVQGERLLQYIEEAEAVPNPLAFSYTEGRLLFAPLSRPDQLQSRPAPCPAEQTADLDAPALRILAMGISLYNDPRRNLPMARNDAAEFVRVLQQHNVRQYRAEPAIKIYDRIASRQGILHGLERLASIARAQDVAVIYYAGHGVLNGGEFYLLPADAADPESANRISAAEFAAAVGRISAKRKLVIVDACQSGGALTKLAKILSTARGTSIRVMASSQSGAMEMRRLNHGIMTYAVLQSLGQNAFSASELIASVKKLVPEICRRSFPGKEQTVTVFSRGPDFPLASR